MSIAITILVFLMIPFLVFWPFRKNYKNFYKALGLCELLSNGIIAVLFFCVTNSFTVYEYILISVIVTLVAIMLSDFAFNRDHICIETLLKYTALITVFISIYSILTYGQSGIHSDTATASVLAKSILDNQSLFPKTFNYANGDLWVLSTQIICIGTTSLMKDQSLARAVASAVWVILACLGVIFQSKRIFKNNSWILSVPIILVFIGGDMVLYQAAYTGLIIWLTVCTSLFSLELETENNIRYIIASSVLVILLAMTGARILAEIVVPAMAAIFTMLYFELVESEDKEYRIKILRRSGLISSFLVASTIIGYGIYKWITTWHNMNNTVNNATIFTDSLNTVSSNLCNTILGFFDCFGFQGSVQLFSFVGFRNLVSVTICILMCFVVPVCQGIHLENEDSGIRFFYIFSMIHNLEMILLAVFFGKITSRYLLTSIFLLVIISSRYIYANWIMTGKNRYLWTGAFLIAVLIECVCLLTYSTSWYEKLMRYKAFNQELLSYGVDKGYATYWNAYNNEIYSDFDINYAAVDISEEGISPFSWLVDSKDYYVDDCDSFLLLTESENAVISDYIMSRFGRPKNNFILDGNYIYIFDYDIASTIKNGLEDGVLNPLELNLTEGGGSITRNRVKIIPGGTQFGPYTEIKKGEYTVTFYGNNLDDSDYDIHSESTQDCISYKELSKADKEIVVKLTIDKDIDDIEFRVSNNTNDKNIKLTKITVELKCTHENGHS